MFNWFKKKRSETLKPKVKYEQVHRDHYIEVPTLDVVVILKNGDLLESCASGGAEHSYTYYDMFTGQVAAISSYPRLWQGRAFATRPKELTTLDGFVHMFSPEGNLIHQVNKDEIVYIEYSPGPSREVKTFETDVVLIKEEK